MMLTKTGDQALKEQVGKALDEAAGVSKAEDKEREMWDYVIEKHGRKEFEAVYKVIL